MTAWADTLRRQTSPWNGLKDGPRVGPDGSTRHPGLWIVGDLAQAPVIKAALADGDALGLRLLQALAASQPAEPVDHDVLVVGAGPAGAATALRLVQGGVSVALVEQDRAFSTLAAFPATKTLYAEPRYLPNPSLLPFEDGPAHALVAAWRSTLAQALPVQEHTRLADLSRDGTGWRAVLHHTGDAGSTSQHSVRARHVVLALGRRAHPRSLDLPQATAPWVHHALHEPTVHAGQTVVVVGGGDSAVEAAVALHQAGATVHLVHRGEALVRPGPTNRTTLQANQHQPGFTVHCSTQLADLTQGAVQLEGPDGRTTLPATQVFLLLGADPPLPLLRRLGLPLRSDRPWWTAPALVAWLAAVWCFYVLKTGRPLPPFGPHTAGWMHQALTVPLPWYPTADGSLRTVDGGFWGTVLYTALIVGGAAFAVRRHNTPTQRRRYASLVGFQVLFLFGIPELLAPMVTTASGQLYNLSVPWPLRLDSLAVSPDVPAAGLWLLLGAFTAFVALPAFVVRHNERFCSWMCGCGGLAETLGDLWRWRAPRGPGARRAELGGRAILALALPLTLLILADTWALVAPTQWMAQELLVQGDQVELLAPTTPERPGAIRLHEATVRDGTLDLHLQKLEADGTWSPTGWTSQVQLPGGGVTYATKQAEGHYTLALAGLPDRLTLRAASSPLSSVTGFARHWYQLMVDFVLASLVGVAAYPLLGNRVWCRFFCPLRAYMEAIAARWGRLAIQADDRCIQCGNCTTSCQMGIDVQGFAHHQALLDNRNSACIQCGVCVEVCPVGVLSLVDRVEAGLPPGPRNAPGPRW